MQVPNRPLRTRVEEKAGIQSEQGDAVRQMLLRSRSPTVVNADRAAAGDVQTAPPGKGRPVGGRRKMKKMAANARGPASKRAPHSAHQSAKRNGQ